MLNFKRSSSRRLLVGLDIEPGGVHAAQVSVNGRLVVDRAAYAPLEPGVVRDGEVVDAEALARALQDLFEQHKLDRHVRIGVANQRIVVRTLQLPPISDGKELAAAVRFQAADQVPMPLDQAVLDHVPLGIVETPEGPRQRVLIVAARRDMIERLLDTARAAGLRPEGIDLSAFAMLRALGRTEAPVLHLSVGGIVNLAVAREGECLFTRIVAGGLEQMAIDLAERRNLTVENARTLLRETGIPAEAEPIAEPTPSETDTDVDAPDGDAAPEHSRATADLAAAVQRLAHELEAEPEPETAPRRELDADEARAVLAGGVRRIAAEVRNSLDFFHEAAEAPVERVALTGSAAGVPGFAEALEQRLGLRVVASVLDAPGADAPERFTVAAGLAVQEAPA